MGLVKTADRANFLIRHLAEFGGGPETDCVRYTLSELASVPRHAGGSRRSFTYIYIHMYAPRAPRPLGFVFVPSRVFML